MAVVLVVPEKAREETLQLLQQEQEEEKEVEWCWICWLEGKPLVLVQQQCQRLLAGARAAVAEPTARCAQLLPFDVHTFLTYLVYCPMDLLPLQFERQFLS